MANYSNLKAAIAAAIKTNGNQEITGQVLQDVLTSIVSVIGANYTFAGVATPSTNPGTPDQNLTYLAMEGGTYTNFSGMVLPAGISLLMWNGTWTSETVMYGDGGVFDISVYKSSGGTLAKFADLAAALDGGNNIPTSARKGGMSVKFVQSSDNKYVRFNYLLDDATTVAKFINVDNWQRVCDGGLFNQITVTDNFYLNQVLKEAHIVTLKYGSAYYSVDDIDLIAVNKALLSNGTYYSGVVIRVNGSIYISNCKTFSNQQDALAACTTHFVFGDNEYIIDFNAISTGGQVQKECKVNKEVEDIKFWTYLNSLYQEAQYNGSFVFTDNNSFNKVVKEMYITSNIDISSINEIAIIKDLVSDSSHITGLSIKVGSTYISRWYTCKSSEEALKKATTIFEHSGDYFIIDWDALQLSDNKYKDIQVNQIVKDINYSPSIQFFINFAISNDQNFNNVVKEMYIGSSLDVKKINTISVIKDLVSGSNHLTGLAVQLEDNSWVSRFKTFATSEEAVAAATPIFSSNGDYFLVDWTGISNNIFNGLKINRLVKDIDFSPSIKEVLDKERIINITNGSNFISEMERAFELGNCIVNISIGTLDLSSLAEQYWNNDQYSIRGRFCQIGNNNIYNFSSNTKIVCNYTGDEIVLMRNFSIFNADGTDFELNGLIAEGSKLRYIIHDDPSNKNDTVGYQHIYNNCQLKLDNSNVPDVAANNNYYDTIGGGIGSNTTIIIRGGIYNSISNGHETIPLRDFCFHGYYYDHDYLSRVIVENVYLMHTLATGKISGQEQYGEIELIVNNCSMAEAINNGDTYDATIIQWNNEIRGN